MNARWMMKTSHAKSLLYCPPRSFRMPRLAENLLCWATQLRENASTINGTGRIRFQRNSEMTTMNIPAHTAKFDKK